MRQTYVELTHKPSDQWLIICRICGPLGVDLRMWPALAKAKEHDEQQHGEA